jgi:hypothetical protein
VADNDFDFWTNGIDGDGDGQCPCSLTNVEGMNICSAEDNTFYVRVYRLAGYPVTDESYTLQFTNGI